MATWIVNTNADDGSVDTNPDSLTYRTGSLRGIIGAAASGDTIIFDATIFPANVETSILLETALNLPAKTLTIDGGETWTNNGELKTRVVLDAQYDGVNSTRSMITNYVGNSTLHGLTFQNGGGNIYGGCFVFQTSGQNNLINDCVFCNGQAAQTGGGVAVTSTGSGTFNNCLFKNCSSGLQGGGIGVTGNAAIALNNCSFFGNTATHYGASVFYSSTSALKSIVSCVIGATSSVSNVYVSSTNTTIKDITCDKIVFGNNSVTTINGNLTADVLTISNGAAVTFDGVDSILAVTTTATIGAATFTAAADSTGYLALPDGTTPPTVGAGVHVATYSTATPTISATITNRVASIDIKNAGSGYITEVEYADGTVDDLTITEGAAEIAVDEAFKIRLFNGAFYYSPFVPRTYYLKTYDVDGDFATAADWTLDAAKTLTCNAAPTIQNGTFYCTAPEV